MSLTPRGMNIQEAYRLYAEERLTVNRKYQRKLVWSENEKKHLIDSIEKEFPIPLFMLARAEAENSFEIIDGMQRFNAIFSFIEHCFTDELGRCFDLEQFTRAKLSRDAGIFEEYHPDVERLTPDACARFLEYQLAVTIDADGDEDRINEVFGRINSGGRQLSPQEQRQAGLVSDYSEFVRRLAMELRGDSSPDVVLLNQMPEVSFNTPREKQRYGIDASDVFWCKHGIITPNDLAKGEDEQVITDISISLLNGKPLNASREIFDLYFVRDSEEFAGINASLNSYGAERLRNEIIVTLSCVRSVFEGDEFHSFRNTVQKKPSNTARTAFYAVFMSFFDLIFNHGQIPHDLEGIRGALANAQEPMTRGAHHVTTEDRIKNIDMTTGIIQKFFVKRDVSAIGSAHSLIVDIENSLRRSKYEASRYEFKVGICSLEDSAHLDENMFAKLARTACAIANANPNEDGYIYLGVADSKKDADRASQFSGKPAIIIGDVHFCGLDHDLSILSISLEEYMKRLIVGLQAQPISKTLLTQLVAAIDHAEYKSRPFLRIRVPAQSDLSLFGDRFPTRKNSETVDMTTSEAVAQSKLFK